MAAALHDLSQRSMATGDQAAAVAWARRRTALRPLDEAAGADLIKVLLKAGDGPGALEAFRDLRRRLQDELGVPVSAATAALVAALSSAVGQPGQVGADQPAAYRAQDAPASTPSAGL